ncbi:MAG: isochorismatase family protein [Planctomycetota bacterium]
MRSPKLVSAKRAALLVVDIQERLAAAMDETQLQEVVGNAVRLIETAKVLSVGVLATEQYPKGLGSTLPAVREALGDAPVFEKLSFSALGSEGVYARLKEARAQDVALVGMETHVCVSQSAYDLAALGMRPVVVSDAAISRFREDHDGAIARFRADGIAVTTTEALIFELLESAGTEAFEKVRKLVRRKER